jgi:predicted HAD superfamily phosphohydrolase YqeG
MLAVRIKYVNLFIVKKTIIFDLDETLVHCIDDIENNPCD